jgi:septal ring factor EnvC (AmiA/AmiB activator)
MGLDANVRETSGTEPTHEQLQATIIAAIKELKTEIGKVSEKLSNVESAQHAINTRIDRIDQRLADGDRRMTEQDKSLVFQSRVIRSSAQLKAIRKTLDGEIEQLELLEHDALERIMPEHAADPDETTKPGNPRPAPESADTLPAPAPDSSRE